VSGDTGVVGPSDANLPFDGAAADASVAMMSDARADAGGNLGIALGSRSVVTIDSPRGASLETVIISPNAAPSAALILLEGGDGLITLGGNADDPQIQSQGFLARNADLFAAKGLLVALVGAPSDHSGGIEIAYRISEDQSTDVAAVITWLDARVSLPIWVLGMSLGSYSVSNTAIRLGGMLDGYAVCSASTAPPGGPRPNGILDLALDQITVPAVVVGHMDDACPGTPSSGVARIADALTASPMVSQRVFTGGDPAQSGPCGPLAPHGYLGIEDEVVTYMAGIFTSP